MLNMQGSAKEGEEYYYQLEVCKEPGVDYYIICLLLQTCGHHVVRIMCDGNVIGPNFFSVIYLTRRSTQQISICYTRNYGSGGCACGVSSYHSKNFGSVGL